MWAQKQRQELKDAWERGVFTVPDVVDSQINAKAIGKCEVYLEVSELTYEALIEALYDDGE